MSSQKTLSGKCLCGGVKFTVKVASANFGACHCSMCRTWSGGVVFALDEVKDLTFEGEHNLSIYKSSDWGERGFCKVCGTNLFWRSAEFGHTAVMAGAIEEQAELKFVSEIFIDSKPDFYTFADDTKKYTEAEVLAQFSGSDK